MYKIFFNLCIFCFLPSFLTAEIEEVSLLWKANFCTPACEENLLNKLKRLPEVESLKVTSTSVMKTAHLKIKKNHTFTFAPYDNAFMSLGISLEDVKVKATGKIEKRGLEFTLNVEENHTKFSLLGSPKPSTTNYVNPFSPYNRQLKIDFLSAFEGAFTKKTDIQVEGTLFEPERSPPLWLIVEKVTSPKETKHKE